uniref:T-cell receptor alpha/delta variable 10.0.5 n=1 Tax=Sinocyclocheilus grahami TaxID=75366 RepID=A0A672PZX6_SINGR
MILYNFHSFLSTCSIHFADGCFAQTITPLQDRTQVTEGEPVNLSCKYDVSVQNLRWYRQYPGSGLEFLLLVVESSRKTVVYADPPIPRLDGEMSIKDKRVDLTISSAEVTDSALYYCALQPTSMTFYVIKITEIMWVGLQDTGLAFISYMTSICSSAVQK